MVAWEIRNMGGVLPRTDDRLIPDNMAVEAVNVDLTGGQLRGLPQSEFLIDLGAGVERAYRFPDHGGNTVWLRLPSRYSCVVRSPVVNDVYDRVYWTNPGDQYVHVNTAARIQAGQGPWDLGFVLPTTAPTITSVVGGTPPPGATAIDRVYVYTYVNQFEEESAPSPTSNLASGPPDATWNVGGFPTTAPPPGNFPTTTKLRIYRTITSASAGAQFYFVSEHAFPWAGNIADTQPDSLVANNEILETTGYRNPPDYLDGLVIMPGGFLAGFTGRDVHFSEPNRPYAWPDVYDQTADYKIVTLAVWQQYLVVLTEGYPSAGSGNTPSNIVLTQTQVAEPCIARGSAIVDLAGVFYASQNGLIQFTGYSMTNITAPMLEKNEWLLRYHARSIQAAARHRAQFIAINNTELGFLVDYSEQRLGFQDLSYLHGVVCIWNDEYTGDTLLCAGGRIYEWDHPGEAPQVYRWKSKQFFTPVPMSLGAVQVDLDREVLTTVSEPYHPLDNGDPGMDLPAGINAVFRYYAGPLLQLIMTRNLTRQMEIFRLPNGFKCFDHQVEITARVPVSSIQISTTLNELKSV